MRTAFALIVAAGLILSSAPPAAAYSVLSHEAAIDDAWSEVRALLLQRYPRTSAEGLTRARSFAYGGSVIQDLGYYPFGNKFFSNLLHYTRSGDFVEALLRDAGDVDEFAFALGALAHYANDNAGHPLAVNLAVARQFPKLKAKFGDRITYVQAPKQHVIVEFSYDVAETARGRYPDAKSHALIGFRVAVPLLERAFRETYGLEMNDLFSDTDRAISTYRYSVSQIIPSLTRAAWKEKGDEIPVFRYARKDFERDYGRNYQKPGKFARFLGVVYRIVPKVGPLKPLAFKAPTADVDQLFAESVVQARGRFLNELRAVRDKRLQLANTDFDTGKPAQHGEYALADETYAELLSRLEEGEFEGVPAALQRNIVAFYGTAPRPTQASHAERKHWDRVQRGLATLKGASPTAPAEAAPRIRSGRD